MRNNFPKWIVYLHRGCRVAFCVCGPFVLLFFWGPQSFRTGTYRIADTVLGGEPNNQEYAGIYTNINSSITGGVSVAIYNSRRKQRLFTGIGGDDFRLAALAPRFTHRISASTSEEAASLLGSLLSTHPMLWLRDVTIFGHGRSGVAFLGPTKITEDFLSIISSNRSPGIRPCLTLAGCSVASGEEGKSYIQSLASTHDLRVLASIYPTRFNSSEWSWGSFLVAQPDQDSPRFLSDAKHCEVHTNCPL